MKRDYLPSAERATAPTAKPQFGIDDRVEVFNGASEFHHATGTVLCRSKRTGNLLVSVDGWDAWEPLGLPSEHLLPAPAHPTAVWFRPFELRAAP